MSSYSRFLDRYKESRWVRIFGVVRSAFHSAVNGARIPDHEAVKKEIARGVVRRTATGNFSLQRGRYLSREDLDRRLEAVKGYKFHD